MIKNQEPRCQDAKEIPRIKMPKTPKKNQEPRRQEAKEEPKYKQQKNLKKENSKNTKAS